MRHRQKGWSERAGFTLIELLVVISVIMLLAALALPVLMKAIRQADLTTCRSNLRQVGTAIVMYTSNWHSRYPPTDVSYRYNISRKGGGKVNVGQLYPKFLPDGRVFYCPSLEGGAGIGEYDSPAWGWVKYPDDYCVMGYIYAVHAANGKSLKRPQPSQQAILADNVIRYNSGDWGCGHWCHVTGYNVLYADNSVVWFPDPDESIAWAKIHSGTTRLRQAWDAFTNRVND